MSRKPKDGATHWNLHVQEVVMELFWPLHNAASHAQKEFGEWVLDILTEAAAQEFKGKKPPKEKRAKTSPATRAVIDRER